MEADEGGGGDSGAAGVVQNGMETEEDLEADLLRRRCRALTEGKVLGSEAFVEAMGRGREERVSAEEEKKGGRSRGEEASAAGRGRGPGLVGLAGGVSFFSWIREKRAGK